MQLLVHIRIKKIFLFQIKNVKETAIEHNHKIVHPPLNNCRTPKSQVGGTMEGKMFVPKASDFSHVALALTYFTQGQA